MLKRVGKRDNVTIRVVWAAIFALRFVHTTYGAVEESYALLFPAFKLSRKVNPKLLKDVASVSFAIYVMYNELKKESASASAMGQEYKVYFPHDHEMRFSHKMSVVLERSSDDFAGFILSFERFPKWKPIEECYDHQYVFSRIEWDADRRHLKLVQDRGDRRIDLITVVQTLFDNELLPDIKSRGNRHKKKLCILM
jgi:hypothetical protein